MVASDDSTDEIAGDSTQRRTARTDSNHDTANDANR
jgi:hypothetical protein